MSTTHDSFTIERTYAKASPARVFAAFADEATKRHWFGVDGPTMVLDEHTLDFRVGGREVTRSHMTVDAPFRQMRNDTVYLHIEGDRRIVFAYTMTIDERPISASLATIEISAAGDGTRLRFTEQAAFFEGSDGSERRRGGWTALLDRLGASLAARA